jgi:hypothetical protein
MKENKQQPKNPKPKPNKSNPATPPPNNPNTLGGRIDLSVWEKLLKQTK